jgi:hypothetical protein
VTTVPALAIGPVVWELVFVVPPSFVVEPVTTPLVLVVFVNVGVVDVPIVFVVDVPVVVAVVELVVSTGEAVLNWALRPPLAVT